MERARPPPKSGVDEKILADIYEELEVSYNKDLQLRIDQRGN